MLTIRKQQMAALRAGAIERFKDRMIAYIAAEYPRRHEALGDQGTRQLVQKGIDAGERYHLETEGAVGVLIELMVQFGERLEMSPDRAWAQALLEHPTLPGPVKVTAIRERLTARTGGRLIVPARGAGPA